MTVRLIHGKCELVGIERDAQWLPIAEARIRACAPLFAEVTTEVA